MRPSRNHRTSRYYHVQPWYPENQQNGSTLYEQNHPYVQYQYPYGNGQNMQFLYNQQHYNNPYPQQPHQGGMHAYNHSALNNPFSNPYPTNAQQQQNSGFQTVLAQFKKEDGTYDVDKMMNTAGQMMGTVNQVSGMVKGISSIFKV